MSRILLPLTLAAAFVVAGCKTAEPKADPSPPPSEAQSAPGAATAAPPAGPTSKYVTVNGLELHYLDWGHPQKPPLVLLHGMTSLARVYDHLAAGLSERYHVLALDQRGHGESEAAQEYTEELYLSDLEGFIGQLGLEKPVLVGMSMGGRFAAEYAARHPDEVAKVVIIEGPFWDEEDHRKYGERLRAGRDFAVPSREEIFNALMTANPRFDEAQVRNFLEHNLKPTGDGKLTWKYDRELRGGKAGEAFIQEMAEHRWDRWRQVKAPTLIVRGEHSPATPKPLAERLAQENPNARVVHVADAGTTVHIERPDELLRVIREFLQEG